jgi:outer membrane immunogenic protein
MFANLKGAHEQDQVFSEAPLFGGSPVIGGASDRFSTNVNDLATIGVRLGSAFGPENRGLWYVKGGGAWVRNTFSENVMANALFDDGFTNSFNGSGSVHVNQWGWMVGTGFEWGVLGNLSAKIEYEFLDFGTHNFTMPVAGTLSDNFGDCVAEGNCSVTFNRNFSVQQQIHVVKVGLNYRFWGY